MSAVAKARMQDLIKVQCTVFNQSYNPSLTRTGNKILRQRLHGDTLAAYYPPRYPGFKDLMRMFPKFGALNKPEIVRLEGLTIAKAKGKGAPKKRRTAEESKKFTKKRPSMAKAPAG